MSLFSERTGWKFEESAWSLAAAKARLDGVIDLSETNPSRCGFQHANASVLSPFADTANMLYEPDCQGLGSARLAVSSYYAQKGAVIPKENIFLTAGTSEAFSYLFKLLVNPGESVLVPEPGYPLLDHLAQLSDIRLIRYPLHYDERAGWSINREKLEALLVRDIKAIVLVNPNNPTGHFVSESERLWLEDVAGGRNTAIISDEVFLDFAWEESLSPGTFAQNKKALTFTLSGISKILGLPQMKLSWMGISGPEASVREAKARLSVIADAYLSVSGPPQRALEYWLTHAQAITGEIAERVRTNRICLESVSSARLRVLPAQGGWQSVVRFTGDETDEEASLALMKRGVLVMPGYLFDLPEHHLVVSLLPRKDVFERGAAPLREYFRSA